MTHDTITDVQLYTVLAMRGLPHDVRLIAATELAQRRGAALNRELARREDTQHEALAARDALRLVERAFAGIATARVVVRDEWGNSAFLPVA